MKNKMLYISLSVLFLLIVSFCLWQYVFNIYEVEIGLEPKELFADDTSTLTVKVIPINSFGKRAPLRTVECIFQIIEGKELVDIIEQNQSVGEIIFKAKSNIGKLVLKIRTGYSVAPMLVEINIQKNLT